MSTPKLTTGRPLWWLCFTDRVVFLRKQKRWEDIQYFHTSLDGYISGLFCAEAIEIDQRQLLDLVADNAKDWAWKDAQKEAL